MPACTAGTEERDAIDGKGMRREVVFRRESLEAELERIGNDAGHLTDINRYGPDAAAILSFNKVADDVGYTAGNGKLMHATGETRCMPVEWRVVAGVAFESGPSGAGKSMVFQEKLCRRRAPSQNSEERMPKERLPGRQIDEEADCFCGWEKRFPLRPGETGEESFGEIREADLGIAVR